ncbi:MAG: phosphatidate phosphatase App1 family protein [Planctomycetota bacterium]
MTSRAAGFGRNPGTARVLVGVVMAAGMALAASSAVVANRVDQDRVPRTERDQSEAPSVIKSDEEVVFYPSYGRRTPDGAAWELTIRGRIFEREANSLWRGEIVEQLSDALDLPSRAVATDCFQRRMRSFLVDNESAKRVGVVVGTETHVLPASGANGYFEGGVQLSEAARGDTDVVRFKAVTAEGDTRLFEGVVRLLDTTGVSVVCDIDDTVKISEVRDKRALLRNTFVEEFRVVPGMAELLPRVGGDGCAVHYVSGSPWQLLEELEQFFRRENLPAGTWHLRQFRLKDRSVVDMFAGPEPHKLESIGALCRAFPARRFVLVGDSGEQDPEIYGEIARRFGEQVKRILIRNITNETRDNKRALEAFRGVDGELWEFFTDPAIVK